MVQVKVIIQETVSVRTGKVWSVHTFLKKYTYICIVFLGIKKKSEAFTSPDVIYETRIKSMDTESWENIRGPRPWENDGTYTEKMKQKARMDKEKQRSQDHEPET